MTYNLQSSIKPQRKVFEDEDDINEEVCKFKRKKAEEQKSNKRKFSSNGRCEKDTTNKIPALGTGNKPDWKKMKQDKKELKLKRKRGTGGGNEIYELAVKAKKIWEEVRREDCQSKKKVELCKELYTLIEGKTKSLIFAHDTVRVIETLVSVGGEEFRTRLFLELKDDLLHLIKNKYSRFFVLKLLKHGTKEQKISIIHAMLGHVVELMRHKIACDVLELAYNDYANAEQRSHMIQEFFGPRFKYFKEDVTTLEAALEKFPDLKTKILLDVSRALQPILEKGVFTNTLVHTLLKEYLYVCSESEKRNVIEMILKGLLPILHTRDGARVAMLCLWNGTPKDRKVILKSFKSKFVQIAIEEYGHMILLAVFDCVDDIVLIQKTVLSELMAELNKLVENENGRKVLKYMVAPRNKIFFHPDILSVLQEGDNNAHSKKDLNVKYKEIQNYIAKPILKLIHSNIKSWIRDPHWTLFIGSALLSLSNDLIVPIFEAIADMCAEPFMPGMEMHFLEVSYISKMVTFIIQGDQKRFQEKKPLFSTSLLAAAETEMPGWTISNRGCFILVNLLETEIPEIVEEVTEICQRLKGRLLKRDFKGAEVLLKKLNKN